MSFFKLAKKENALVLTTPKRNELLKDGPSEIKFNRCQILGRGAYGTVFKAIYREHPVALKIIKSSAICTLHNESHVLNWKHRNIVRLIKLESTPDYGLLIMERTNGLCLQRVVDTLALPLLHRVLITLDILAALRYCHCQNVLHLDVKPTNVLVALGTKPTSIGKCGQLKRNYMCKLCDFGSSIRLGDPCADEINAKGTLRYMSPEALRSSPLSSASDIYSLGITMWQLQARRLPFYTLTCNESIAYQVVKHDLRPDNYTLLEALKVGSPNVISCDCDEGLETLDIFLYRKARRNLNFDSTHGRVQKRLKKPRGQPRLAHYFDDPIQSSLLVACLKNAYSELYRNCWNSQPELRLTSFQLQKGLEHILAKCLS